MPICKKCGQNLLFTMKGECASAICSKKPIKDIKEKHKMGDTHFNDNY